MLGPGRSMMMDACDDSNVDLANCIFALFLNFGWILAVTISMVDVERIAPSNDDSPPIIRRTQVLLAIETVIAILCVIGACTYRLRPSPRSLHSNDDAADNLTAVKVPPVQSALHSRPLVATCVLQFTGYTLSACVHWCKPPSNVSCVCVNSCHASDGIRHRVHCQQLSQLGGTGPTHRRLVHRHHAVCIDQHKRTLRHRSSVRARLPVLSQSSKN